MPVQLKRLLLVFAFLLAIMLAMKYFLTPESWREFGPYRGMAITEIGDKEAKFVQMDDCAMCHDSIADLKNGGMHASLQCEICHGPGYLHIEDETIAMEIPEDGNFCIRCHEENAARPKNIIKQVNALEHSEGEECITCHNPHQPWL
jgi:hypothetical protein